MSKCSICFSKHREKIDIALTQGESERSIAKRFKVGASAIHRHKADGHICQAIEAAAIEKQAEIGINIASSAKEIYDICLRAAKKAENHDLRALGSCIAPAVKVLEILSKGNPEKPDGEKKDSGFMAGYMNRASKVYAETESPPPQ